jgi:aryl-alcohol dehydrogenase-like predicted oxidoreductase
VVAVADEGEGGGFFSTEDEWRAEGGCAGGEQASTGQGHGSVTSRSITMIQEMRSRTLGRTGLAVSEIALGTVELGLDYGIGPAARKPEESEAARILHLALDLGINFLDTARAYGDAETIIGRALAGRRREFVLCTKAMPGDDAIQSVERSLRALQTDMLDIVMIHCRAGELEPPAEVTAGLQRCREAGKLRFTGASVYGEDAALAAIEAGFDCLQIAVSVLDRRMEARVLPEASRKNVGIVARSVLLKGVLSPRVVELPPELAPLKDAAMRLGAPLEELPELAYRYLLGQNPPHTLLVGAGRVEEVEAAVRFASLGPLPAAQCEALRRRAAAMLEDRYLTPAYWPAVG